MGTASGNNKGERLCRTTSEDDYVEQLCRTIM